MGSGGAERKTYSKDPWRHHAEQGGPEQDADDDLAHRRRLPDAVRDLPAQARGQNDHGQLQQGEEQQCLGLMDRDGVRGRRHIMPPFTEMIWPVI